MESLKRSLESIFDLGFYTFEPFEAGSGSPTMDYAVPTLGAAFGLFFSQRISLDDGFHFIPGRFGVGAFAIALILSLALFGPFMRYVNKRFLGRKKSIDGLLQIALPFGFGFFLGSTPAKAMAMIKSFFT